LSFLTSEIKQEAQLMLTNTCDAIYNRVGRCAPSYCVFSIFKMAEPS